MARHFDTGKGKILATVAADGAWLLSRGSTALAKGQEKAPVLAAMDANEAAWAYQEHHPVEPTPPYQGGYSSGCWLETTWDGGVLTKHHQCRASAEAWLARRLRCGCEITVRRFTECAQSAA